MKEARWTAALIAFAMILASHHGAVGAADGEPIDERCHFADLLSGGDRQQQALRCYRAAAHSGDHSAQMVVGLACWNGKGLARDRVEGFTWLSFALGGTEQGAAQLKYYEWQLSPEDVAKALQSARKRQEACCDTPAH